MDFQGEVPGAIIRICFHDKTGSFIKRNKDTLYLYFVRTYNEFGKDLLFRLKSSHTFHLERAYTTYYLNNQLTNVPVKRVLLNDEKEASQG